MKKLQTICAATLLVLAFGIPALADDGIMGMGDKPPQPPTTSSTPARWWPGSPKAPPARSVPASDW